MRLLPRREKKSADGTMSLMEHLYELRRRLVYATLAIVLGTIIGFVWFTVAIPALHIPSLSAILINPYCSVPSPPRVAFNGGGCDLLATTPFSPLQIRFKAALMAGFVFSSPVWLYQVWAYITPALYERERKFAISFVVSAATLFVAGAVLAYVVIKEGLRVLLGFAGSFVSAGLDPDKYFTFLISMLIIFGLSFEVPLLLVMLNFAGVIKSAKLAKARRYAIFGMVVLAALVVPGNDPVTMLSLAVSLAVLYEVAVQITRVHDRRRARREIAEGLEELSDDEAAPLPAGGPGATGAPTAIDKPMPLDRADLGDVT